MLLLGLAAIAPGVCVGAGLLLTITACQLILGQTAPAFPRRIAVLPFPTRVLAKGLVVSALALAAVWETVMGAEWIGRFW